MANVLAIVDMLWGEEEGEKLAGSAISQGVGLLTNWEEWRPGKVTYGWLLIAGATNPPKRIQTSERRSKEHRSGNFLDGTKYDMQVMEDFVTKIKLGNLHNTLRMLDIKKDDVVERIMKFFTWCKEKEYKPVLYYSGHGEYGSGDWCFSDGTISVDEIENNLPVGTYYPLIISDCCYSGRWSNYCLNRNKSKDLEFHCLSACPEDSTALDIANGGGELTMWMTGQIPRPSKEPLYSAGTRKDYGFKNKPYHVYIRR